jgi:hypothetical protein
MFEVGAGMPTIARPAVEPDQEISQLAESTNGELVKQAEVLCTMCADNEFIFAVEEGLDLRVQSLAQEKQLFGDFRTAAFSSLMDNSITAELLPLLELTAPAPSLFFCAARGVVVANNDICRCCDDNRALSDEVGKEVDLPAELPR